MGLSGVRRMIERLPPPALERILLRRAAVVSVFIHLLAAAGFGATGRSPAGVFPPPAPVVLLLWAVVFLVVRVTLGRDEVRLLSDLAVSWVGVAAVTVAACAAVEVTLGLAARVLIP